MKLSAKKSTKSPELINQPGKIRRGGMTLIELLISLSIIAMMTAVALPSFSYYQKRNYVVSDAQALAQLLSYARALQNNPDNFVRVDPDGNYTYIVKLINSNGINRATLYSTANGAVDSNSVVVDSVDFFEDILVTDAAGAESSGDNLTLSFSGKSPEEILTCTPVACGESIKIGFTTGGGSPIAKNVTIQNTTTTQLMSIEVN